MLSLLLLFFSSFRMMSLSNSKCSRHFSIMCFFLLSCDFSASPLRARLLPCTQYFVAWLSLFCRRRRRRHRYCCYYYCHCGCAQPAHGSVRVFHFGLEATFCFTTVSLHTATTPSFRKINFSLIRWPRMPLYITITMHLILL